MEQESFITLQALAWGFSYTPNLFCNSRLEREGIQNLIKFPGKASTILLEQCPPL